jgi:hypothetical protein
MCAWMFGTVGADGANQTINGHRYIMQTVLVRPARAQLPAVPRSRRPHP